MENNKDKPLQKHSFYVVKNGKKHYKPCCKAAVDDFVKYLVDKFGNE